MMNKFKAYYKNGNKVIADGAFFQAKNATDAQRLAKRIYGDDVVQVVQVRLLKCYHVEDNGKGCDYTWEYSGRRTKSATCPNCYKQVKILSAAIG